MKMRKVLAVVLTFALIITIAGCGRNSLGSNSSAPLADANSGPATDASSGDASPIVIKVAHTDSDVRSTNVAALQFKDYMESNTNGRVVVEVYPNGQLGDDEDLVKAIQFGTCHIYVGGLGVLAGQLGPKMDALTLPFMYDNYEDWTKGMFEKGGLELFNKQLEGSGYINLDFQYDGFRSILTTNKAIHTLEDMNGLKIRVNNTDLYLSSYKAMGANPTPMAFGEVYTGLSQGAIDGVDHVLGVMIDQKYYEPSQYLTQTKHLVSPLLVLSATSFVDLLPEDIKPIFMQGVQEMSQTQREMEYEVEQECVKQMQENGIEVIELNAEERAKFIEAIQPVYDSWRSNVGDELMDKAFEIAGK